MLSLLLGLLLYLRRELLLATDLMRRGRLRRADDEGTAADGGAGDAGPDADNGLDGPEPAQLDAFATVQPNDDTHSPYGDLRPGLGSARQRRQRREIQYEMDD